MNLLQLSFWFNLKPTPLLPMYNKALTGFVILLGLSLIASFFIKRVYQKNLYSKVFEEIYSFLYTNFGIGLILLFFNYEMIPLLSSRFWFILWAIEMGIWIYLIVRAAKKIPARKEQFEKEKEFKKYLPK